MVILDEKLYDAVWKRVYDELKFEPCCKFTDRPAFQINGCHAVYGLGKPGDPHMEETVRSILMQVTKPGERLYALDWQHSAFLYDPRNLEEQQTVWVEDARYGGGGYTAYFPTFYPDGDYYFFIDEQFRFGYLGHPWRREVWVFGDVLVERFDEVYEGLGWTRLKQEEALQEKQP